MPPATAAATDGLLINESCVDLRCFRCAKKKIEMNSAELAFTPAHMQHGTLDTVTFSKVFT